MRKKMPWIMLLGTILHAQDIAGGWQGTLKAGAAEFRVILNLARGSDDGWKATKAAAIEIDRAIERKNKYEANPTVHGVKR